LTKLWENKYFNLEAEPSAVRCVGQIVIAIGILLGIAVGIGLEVLAGFFPETKGIGFTVAATCVLILTHLVSILIALSGVLLGSTIHDKGKPTTKRGNLE
jgi:hypothetical protein